VSFTSKLNFILYILIKYKNHKNIFYGAFLKKIHVESLGDEDLKPPKGRVQVFFIWKGLET